MHAWSCGLGLVPGLCKDPLFESVVSYFAVGWWFPSGTLVSSTSDANWHLII